MKNTKHDPSVTVIVPTRNERGTIRALLSRMPRLGSLVEIIFVDGHSSDGTYKEIQRLRNHASIPDWMTIRLYMQPGKGKWDAVSYGFEHAKGRIGIIFDADLSVDPEVLPEVVSAVSSRECLVTGSRFIYPQEKHAMRILNHAGNIVFSRIFSLLTGSRITDTLCGTKAFRMDTYRNILRVTRSFTRHDPYGDFTLLLGAAKLHLPVIELPITYRARVYGKTNISRFRDGMKLLVVLAHALSDFQKKS